MKKVQVAWKTDLDFHMDGQMSFVRTRRRPLLMLILVAVASLFSMGALAQVPSYIKLPETAVRKRALKIVMPKFPDKAEQRGTTGVVVAEIDIDRTGKVTVARVLQAPDEAMGEAVVEAVKQWVFQPATMGGKAVDVRSKLTFYFTFDHGRGVVKNPSGAPK